MSIEFSIAIVLTAGLLCFTAERISRQWAEAWRYFVKGRVGLLSPPPEPEEDVTSRATPAMRAADAAFEAWHQACEWNSEEQSDHIRRLWQIGLRGGTGEKAAAAVRELSMLGAPLPHLHT